MRAPRIRDSCASSATPAGMRSWWRSDANAGAPVRAVARDAWRKPPLTSSSMFCPSNRSVSGCCRSRTRYGSCSRPAPRCSPKSWVSPARAAKPMSGTPSNAFAATSPARQARTNASRSMTAGRSCIGSSTPSMTRRLMSCSTRWTLSPASPPLKCRSRSELALCHERAPISLDTTPCSPRTSSTVTTSFPTLLVQPPASSLPLVLAP